MSLPERGSFIDHQNFLEHRIEKNRASLFKMKITWLWSDPDYKRIGDQLIESCQHAIQADEREWEQLTGKDIRECED